MRKEFFKKEKGFTLVEVILYISIATMIFLVLSSFVLFMTNTEKNIDIKWAIERDSKKIVTVFEDLVNNSTGVNSPSSGNSDSEVVLSGAILNTLSLNGTDLEIDRGGSSEILNDSDIRVSSFTVNNYSDTIVPETIKIDFTLEADGEDGQIISESFTSSFTLRDYAN